MAYTKNYTKTNWVNSPSTSTPINQTNLNNIESGIDTNDDRIVAMSNTLDTATNDIGTLQGDVTALQTGKQDTLTFDNAPTSGSNNPVKSGGVYSALAGKQDTLTFDNTPTSGSDNPVKSGGVYSALAGKQDTLTFDASPTSGSSNPVTSDGIYQAIAGAGVGNVTSVFSRTGAITAQKGDYGAAKITIDTTNNSLPATLETVQDFLDYAYPPSVTVTLTLNGAKEDSITIYDSNNTQVGSCIFASGQTSGTCTIDVPVGGGSYKFISSVAKDTVSGTSDYEKTVTLSDQATQIVNVMPDKVIYWYGNGTLNGCLTPWTSGAPTVTPTITNNTNSVSFSAIDTGSFSILGSTDFTNATKLKGTFSGYNPQGNIGLVVFNNTTDNIYDAVAWNSLINDGTLSEAIYDVTVSTSGTKYGGVLFRYSETSNTMSGTIKRLWLE